MKKIAVVGGGISGLACAFALGADCAAVYEESIQPGGHACTLPVHHNGAEVQVDTAFMVYNARNYPHFCRLLRAAGARGRATEMSFSVKHEALDLEYNGGGLRGLFADRRNLRRADFRRMLMDILRFNRAARRDAGALSADISLAEYIAGLRLGAAFADAYLLPMGASIWSCSRAEFSRAPARFALSFFNNHGLLSLFNRPQWMHIAGGSRRYVDAVVAALPAGAWRGGRAAEAVRAEGGGVVVTSGGQEEKYDAAVIAAHAPDALNLLSDASAAEREVLSAFTYTKTDAVLHTDISLLPAKRAAWAAWNYRVFADGEQAAATYNLTMLQHLDKHKDKPLLLTLNAGIARVDAAAIKRRFSYSHPLPDAAAMRARARAADINGRRNIYFCGAYWGNGFHEDGAASGFAAARAAAAA